MESKFFILRGLDKPGSAALREALTERHRQYVRKSSAVVMIHGGPLQDENGEVIGTCLIVSTSSKAVLEDWLCAAPC